jgi:hypothetical protein
MPNFLFLIFMLPTILFGQLDSIPKRKLHRSDFSRCGHNIIITTSYNRTKYNSFECSFGRSYSADWNAVLSESFGQYQLGLEALMDGDKIIYAPKICAELSLFKIICISRLNLLYYLNPDGAGSLKYRHEIGLTYRGYVNLNYCMTFNFTNKLYYNLGQGLNLQINIPLGRRKFDRIN